jgi:hypothetical protein
MSGSLIPRRLRPASRNVEKDMKTSGREPHSAAGAGTRIRWTQIPPRSLLRSQVSNSMSIHCTIPRRFIQARCLVTAMVIAALSVQYRGQAFCQNPLLAERAYQDREILYELQSPESHAFRITHDYTVRRAGEAYYFNVVRTGSHVTDPESIDLDTGERLKWEVISGKQARERALPVQDAADDSEVVVTHLAKPLPAGTTNRIRLKETYTDPKSYYLEGNDLVWDRSFGRLRNTVVLPQGWYLTGLATPSIIETLGDGRVSVYTVNPRNDEVRVYLRARRRN